MKERKVRKKFNIIGLLRYVDDVTEAWFPMSRKDVYRLMWSKNIPVWEDYFPSVIVKAANRLERKGWVKKEMTNEGLKVCITDRGKTEILKCDMDNWQPKSGKWDGKWRLVFFDVEEKSRRKRVQLIKYLKSLGLKEMQKSVYISPFDVEKEIKFLREVLEIPNNIKMGVLESVENNDELKEIFGV